MGDPFQTGADVFFVAKDRDWREDRAVAEDEDPDDEELTETPADVIDILGFDPKELGGPVDLAVADRSATESVSPIVDAVIDRGAAAGVAVSNEIRRKVRQLVKKNRSKNR